MVTVPPAVVGKVPGTACSASFSPSVSLASTPGASTGTVTLPSASNASSSATGGVLGLNTVSVAVPEAAWQVAVMVAEPGATPVASPFPSTVATPGLSDDQV